MPAGRSASVSRGVTAPFLWVLAWIRFCLCPPRAESLFSPPLWKFCNQSPLTFKPDSLGIPSPFAGSQGWKAWHEASHFHSSGRASLVFLFSRLWVTQSAGMGFDFIVFEPLIPSRWGFFFFFGCGLSFFGGFQCLLSMAVQQLVEILVLSQEEKSTRPSALC